MPCAGAKPSATSPEKYASEKSGGNQTNQTSVNRIHDDPWLIQNGAVAHNISDLPKMGLLLEHRATVGSALLVTTSIPHDPLQGSSPCRERSGQHLPALLGSSAAAAAPPRCGCCPPPRAAV